MSKLYCSCGNVLFDQTDQISYKAHFIADQDYHDFLFEIENKNFVEMVKFTTKYFQEIFQCSQCNMIIFLRDNKRFDFAPIDKEKSSKILISALGEKWKGTMVAKFENGKSEIWWQTNKDSAFILDLPLEKLKETYYTKFEELTKSNILRGSFLRIDGKIVHDFSIEKK